MNPALAVVLFHGGGPQLATWTEEHMANLDDSDPISILSRQINSTLLNHDGGTALAALSLSLAVTMQLARAKTGVTFPPDIVLLYELLPDFAADIIKARDAQRES